MKPEPMKPVMTPVPVCTPQVPLSIGCAECVCGRKAECAPLISKCDERCWALLGCGYERCLSTLDAECLEAECPEYIEAIESALAVTSCTTDCYGHCIYDLRRPATEDMDAGL